MPEIWLPPREAERQRLEEQAERQRLRAPEPGPDPEPLLHRAWRQRASGEPLYRYRYRRRYWAVRIPLWAWLVAAPLAVLAVVSPWAFWIALAMIGFCVGMVAR